MTKETKTKFRYAKEELDEAIQKLRCNLDNIIDDLCESIDKLEVLEVSDKADSTERITFENYINDCTYKLHEYKNLLLQIMEKTL